MAFTPSSRKARSPKTIPDEGARRRRGRPPGPLGMWLTTHCLLLAQWLPGPAAGPRHPAPLRAREHLWWQHHCQGGVHCGGAAGSPALWCRHGRRGGQNTREPWAGHPQSDSGRGRDPLQATSSVSAWSPLFLPIFLPLSHHSFLAFLSLSLYFMANYQTFQRVYIIYIL